MLCFPFIRRTRARISQFGISTEKLHLLEPLPYIEFLALQKRATAVITDSGGIQEETTYLQVPCLDSCAATPSGRSRSPWGRTRWLVRIARGLRWNCPPFSKAALNEEAFLPFGTAAPANALPTYSSTSRESLIKRLSFYWSSRAEQNCRLSASLRSRGTSRFLLRH